MFKGIIYKCECIITNKIYIGLTILEFKNRKQAHINDSFNENCIGYNYHFHRAIRKYGINNFQWEILSTIEESSIDNLLKILDDLEVYYINKYNSFYNGYNSTKGGQGRYRDRTMIKVFEETGDYLGLFSQDEICEKYNTTRPIIYYICLKKLMFLYRNKKRYIFRYELDDYTEEDICKVKQIHYSLCINMYSIDGNFIGTFENAQEIKDKYNIDRERITRCCRHESSFAYDNKGNPYIFKYGDEKCTNSDIEKAKQNFNIAKYKKCVVAIDSITNEIIGIFDSYSNGAKLFGTQGGKVSEVCNGKRKSSGKFNGHPIFWKNITYDEYLNNKFVNQ